MEWERIVRALNGPLIAKLFLAALLTAIYLFLRRRDTEGRMGGYALAAAFLFIRDIAYAFFPLPEVFLASDLVFAGILLLALAPARRGWPLWVSLGALALPLVLLAVTGLAGIVLPVPVPALRLLALPTLVFILLRAGYAGLRGPLAAGLGLYLLAGGLLDPASFLLQGLLIPLFYSLCLLPALLFFDSAQRELIAAVEYYESSIDSLFELFDATGSAIKAGFSLQEVLDGMIGVAVSKTGAEGGIVLLAEEEDETLAVRALQGRFPPPFKLPESLPREEDRVLAHFRHTRFKPGEGLLGEVYRSNAPLFVPDASADPRIVRNGDEDWLKLRSLMAAPLVMREKVIGALALARSAGEPFAERDFDRLKLLASFGSMAVSNAYTFLEAAERGDIEREAAIAEEIQRTILPRKFPELPRLSVGAFSNPARGVCSDYYDIIPIRQDRAVIAFGDVAGKGVAAGLVMVMIRAILHLIVNSTKDAATLLSWVNRGISGKVDMDHFATLGLLMVNTSSGEVEYANASHQPLVVYRKESDSLETVDIKSIPIGVERTTEYASRRFKLGPGDILLLYSDGVIEAMDENSRQFGRKNLGATLLRNRGRSAREIAEAIREELKSFSGRARQHDDQSLLVVKAKP